MSESDHIDIKARMAGHYRLKQGIFVVALIGLAGWFLYDGYVKYPRQLEIRRSFDRWVAEGKESQWHDYAREEFGYVKKDEPPKRTENDILQQKVIAAGLGVGAVIAGIFYVRSYGRWVAVDDEGLSTNRTAEKVPFDAITRIDRKKWKSKGIAFVYYDKGGERGRILLDDWKFDLKPTRAIMVVLEEHVDDSKFEDPSEQASVTKASPDEAFGDDEPVDESPADDTASADASSEEATLSN